MCGSLVQCPVCSHYLDTYSPPTAEPSSRATTLDAKAQVCLEKVQCGTRCSCCQAHWRQCPEEIHSQNGRGFHQHALVLAPRRRQPWLRLARVGMVHQHDSSYPGNVPQPKFLWCCQQADSNRCFWRTQLSLCYPELCSKDDHQQAPSQPSLSELAEQHDSKHGLDQCANLIKKPRGYPPRAFIPAFYPETTAMFPVSLSCQTTCTTLSTTMVIIVKARALLLFSY